MIKIKRGNKVRIHNIKKWSEAVKERDGNRCRKCGVPPGVKGFSLSCRLVAHHIKARSTHPHLALKMSNGITLCEECHRPSRVGTQSYLFYFSTVTKEWTPSKLINSGRV